MPSAVVAGAGITGGGVEAGWEDASNDGPFRQAHGREVRCICQEEIKPDPPDKARVPERAEVPAAKAERTAVEAPAKARAAVVAAKGKVVAGDPAGDKVAEVAAGPDKTHNISNLPKGGVTMPGFDGSGPMGAGPMTGGRRGICTDAPMPGIRQGYGRGMGRRRGMGPGRGRGFYSAHGGALYPPAHPMGYPESGADEMQRLQADAEFMKRSLSAIEKRIAALAQDDSE